MLSKTSLNLFLKLTYFYLYKLLVLLLSVLLIFIVVKFVTVRNLGNLIDFIKILI